MTEEDPDLLAGDNLDKLRGRNPYPAMSERYRLTEELENARYQNSLLTEKCRQLEKENFSLAAHQCLHGYSSEYGGHRCHEIDRLMKERDALADQRNQLAENVALARKQRDEAMSLLKGMADRLSFALLYMSDDSVKVYYQKFPGVDFPKGSTDG